MEADSTAVGTVIHGTYRVVRRLGEGGMGVVVLARDEVLERDVAIKLIRPELLDGGNLRERFLAEARAMARVNHPNVVQIYGFGEHERTPYLVMELVEGQTLEQWLAKSKPQADLDAGLRILERVCLGTQAIHDAKTVHRDLKPSNVLLDAALRVRVADLGVANLIRREGEDASSEIVGTPSYMAPEIGFSHEVAPELVSRADVYSLGCVAYQLFTGRLPFEGKTFIATLIEQWNTDPVPPSVRRQDLNPAFDSVILRALARDPENRTPTADAFWRELAAARDRTSEPLRILLAEDDDDYRQLLKMTLALEFPYAEIEGVRNGVEALAAFDARPHSVAVVDLDMPQLDGLALTGLLRSRDSAMRVPIIVLTGSGGSSEWKRLSAMGADGFLVKPVNPADLVTLVRRALGDRSRSIPPPKPA